jgi:hypothetical protein
MLRIIRTDFCPHSKIPFYSTRGNLGENSPNLFLFGADKIIRIANLLYYISVWKPIWCLLCCLLALPLSTVYLYYLPGDISTMRIACMLTRYRNRGNYHLLSNSTYWKLWNNLVLSTNIFLILFTCNVVRSTDKWKEWERREGDKVTKDKRKGGSEG